MTINRGQAAGGKSDMTAAPLAKGAAACHDDLVDQRASRVHDLRKNGGRAEMQRVMWVAIGILAATVASEAGAETVQGTARIAGIDSAVELKTGDGAGVLRYRPLAGSTAWVEVPLDTLAPVLAVLADDRLAFLHAPITRWAGDDLVPLRDAMIARTRTAWEQGRAGTRAAQPSQGAVRTRVRALLQYAVALREAGRGAEAIDTLRQERDANPLTSDWDRAEWSTVSNALANTMMEQGRTDDAVALLDQTVARLGGSPYAINVDLQTASILALDGRYAQALPRVDRAERGFVAMAARMSVVPGATAQFDSVRACVLHGLGRTAEAAAALARIDQAAKPTSRRYAPPANRDLVERAALCMRDPDSLVSVWQRDLDHLPAGSQMLVSAQPAYRQLPFDTATLDRARATWGAPPPLRVLPTRYAPALRSWR
ncbi:hypothetical protein [Sphingomonas sp. NPDC079357]|uniref:hypothetical protein n=1 Tax=Sphingomonas sp. NPDC079357 TaxID=3364518 RepID=UPI00384B2F16